jgi:hypothetical protein
MTDEPNADLARTSQLRVISRGSAMRFRGGERPRTPGIASCSTSTRSWKARWFEAAIAIRPDFVPARSGLSDADLRAGSNEGFLTDSEARPRAKGAAEEAVGALRRVDRRDPARRVKLA